MKIHQYSRGLIDARLGVACQPDHAEGWFVFGMAMQYNRRYDGAVATYRKCLELNADHRNATLELDRLVAQGFTGEPKNKSQVQRRTKKTTDQEAEAAFLKEAGNRRHKEGAYEEAIELYSRALGFCGEKANAKAVLYSNRSASNHKLGNNGKALADAHMALKLHAHWSRAYQREGMALEALGRLDEAVEAFANCVECTRLELIDGGMREEEAVKKAQSCPAAKRLFAHREKLAEEAAKKRAAKKAAEAAGDFDVEGAAGDGEACNADEGTKTANASEQKKTKRDKKSPIKKSEPELRSAEELQKEADRFCGGVSDKYRWQQTLHEVTVTVPLPPLPSGGCHDKPVVTIHGDSISVSLNATSELEEEVMGGETFDLVKVEESTWWLDSNGTEVTMQLVKLRSIRCQEQWWPCVIKGDPEIDIASLPALPRYDAEGVKVPGLLDPELRYQLDSFCKNNPLPDHLSDEIKKSA